MRIKNLKRMLCLLVGTLCLNCAEAQVSFTKFKFAKDSPFGCCPGRKMTDAKFKVTGNYNLKYVRVYYYGVNEVGDAVASDIVGAVNANSVHTKYKMINMMGPFLPGEKYKRWASGTFWYPEKVIAFPFRIDLIYMDGEEESIAITEDNYKEYFPCIKEWINVNLEDGI